MTIEEKITKLTNIWYEYVGINHHKDRDCHWSIETEWSYGEKPIYIVRHYGYVYKDIEIYCTTYERAKRTLFSEVMKAINKEKKWAKIVLKNENEWDSEQIKQAKFIMKVTI
jgi:hypothetical protein